MKEKRRFQVKMYPALAMLIIRGAIQVEEIEWQEAVKMIGAGPQPGQDYYGPLKGNTP